MNEFPLTLPDRQLRVSPHSIIGQRAAPLLAILFLGLAGLFSYWQVPDLWHDWQISRNPVIWDGDITNGECTTRKAFFTDCEGHLAYEVDGKSYEHDVSFMFVDAHSGDYYVDLVISGDNPELATMSLAIDKLWNRIILLAAFLALFVALAFAGIWQGIRARRESANLAQPGRLTPVLLAVGNIKKSRGGSHVTYQIPVKGMGGARQFFSQFEPGQEPLMVVDNTGDVKAVGVKHDGAKLPALLDSKLQRLDLTAEERKIALAPLQDEQEEAEREIAAQPGVMARFGRGILTALGVIALLILLGLGYWLYYVTSGSNSHDPFGMEVNNMMPAAINEWACDQLEARFGDRNAPYGCVAADFTSWK